MCAHYGGLVAVIKQHGVDLALDLNHAVDAPEDRNGLLRVAIFDDQRAGAIVNEVPAPDDRIRIILNQSLSWMWLHNKTLQLAKISVWPNPTSVAKKFRSPDLSQKQGSRPGTRRSTCALPAATSASPSSS